MMDSWLGADLEGSAVGDKLALMILAPLAKPAGLDICAALPWLRGQSRRVGLWPWSPLQQKPTSHRK